MSNKEETQALMRGLISDFNEDIKDIEVNNTKESKTPLKTRKNSVKKDVYIITDKGVKKANGVNKNDNYTITFKIDADLTEYLKNIDKITFIESIKSGKIKSTDMTNFVNDLIRQEFYKLLKIDKNTTDDIIKSKWQEYKNNNGL